MENTLLFLLIIAFLAMLFVNIYFRVKVFGAYKKLVQAGVKFETAHFLSPKKMEEEIYPQYPHMKEEIATFVKYIQFSVQMATVLIALITLFGGVLMWYRNA